MSSKPDYVELDHAGLFTRIRPKGRDYGWWIFGAFVTGLFGAATISAVCTGLAGLECSTVLMLGMTGFMVLLMGGMGIDLLTRRVLRLAADGLVLSWTRFGRTTKVHMDLRWVEVKTFVHEGSKGFTTTVLLFDYAPPDEPAEQHRFVLPGGLNVQERPQAKADLAWMVETIEAAVAQARVRPDVQDDAESRAALQALIAERVQ